jgi:hypothetical protein
MQSHWCIRALVHSCILLGLAASVAEAQPADLIGVRAQGMAGAFTAVADDSTATWWNPAGMAGGGFFSSSIEYGHLETPSGTQVKGISMTYPALGVSYYRLPISQMRLPATTDQLAAGRQDEGNLNQFGATIAQSVGGHLVFGSTLKLIRGTQTHGDLDLGAMVTYGRARLGVTLRNATQPTFGSDVNALTLKREVRGGIALTTGSRGAIGTGTVAVDMDLTRVSTVLGEERRVAAGGEIWTANKALGVRGGVNANTLGERNTALSGGLSASIRKGTFIDVQTTGGSDKARHGWGLDLRVTF